MAWRLLLKTFNTFRPPPPPPTASLTLNNVLKLRNQRSIHKVIQWHGMYFNSNLRAIVYRNGHQCRSLSILIYVCSVRLDLSAPILRTLRYTNSWHCYLEVPSSCKEITLDAFLVPLYISTHVISNLWYLKVNFLRPENFLWDISGLRWNSTLRYQEFPNVHFHDNYMFLNFQTASETNKNFLKQGHFPLLITVASGSPRKTGHHIRKQEKMPILPALR